MIEDVKKSDEETKLDPEVDTSKLNVRGIQDISSTVSRITENKSE